jgi:hypothetical protein
MTQFRLTRRGALAGMGGLAATGLLGRPAWAQANAFNVIGHDAHRSAATGAAGGDIIIPWEQEHNASVNWLTLDVPGITDRILREASLGSTSIDMGFIVYMTQRTLRLMEPLEAHLEADPIDGDLSDYPAALLENLMVDGTLRGLPSRITAMGIVYNEAILEERGITEMPNTFEELMDIWRACTYTRADGSAVNGLMFFGTQNLSDGYSNFARTFNGDYILNDTTPVANQEGNIRSLETMKQLFEEGVFSPDCFTTTGQELLSYMSNGRAAFIITSVTNVARLNADGPYAGRFKVMPNWPMAAEFVGEVPYAPLLQSWSMVIPRNAPDDRKELAWSFVKHLTNIDSVVRQTLNGNGPARVSALDDPRLADLPYRDYFATALQHGRVHVPHVPNAVRINDVFVQASQAAILGRTPIREVMDAAVDEVRGLI